MQRGEDAREPEDGPPRAWTGWQRGWAYALLVLVAALLALWGAFLVPFRVGGTLVPVSWVVAVVGVASALALALAPHLADRVTRSVAAAALLAVLAGPAAYTLDTVATPHTGSIPSAGPSTGMSFAALRCGRRAPPSQQAAA